MPRRNPLAELEKLRKCQQILGYEFRNLRLLRDALRVGSPEWKRMATAGDTYVQNTLIDRWYSRRELDSKDFSDIRTSTLSNAALSSVALKKGLHHCINSVVFEGQVQDVDSLEHGWETKTSRMATTVEAVLAAVYRDSLFDDGVRKAIDLSVFEAVVSRLGITHRLISSTSDLRWALNPIRVTRKMPPRFFSSGNHLSLAKMLLDVTSLPPGLSVYKVASSDRASLPWDHLSQGEAFAHEERALEAFAHEERALEALAQEATTQRNQLTETQDVAEEKEPEPAPAPSWLSRFGTFLNGPPTPPTPAETTPLQAEPTPSPAAPETDWAETKVLSDEKVPEPAPARRSWLSRLLKGPSTPSSPAETTIQQQAAAESPHNRPAAPRPAAPQPATSSTRNNRPGPKGTARLNKAARTSADKTKSLQTLSDRLLAIQQRHEEDQEQKRRRSKH